MRIIDIRAIEGRNVHSHYPVIEMTLDLGDYAERRTNEYEGLIDNIVECLPGLASHHCGLGAPGGFLLRMQEGTYFGHVIEHVSLELLLAAGHSVMYGKTRQIGDTRYRVVFEYQCKESGLYAGRVATEIVLKAVLGEKSNAASHIQEIRRLANVHELGPSTRSVARAAEDRGIPVLRLGQTSLLQLGYGSKQRLVEATITSNTSCISADIACDKVLTKAMLAEAGLPVPEGGLAANEEQALDVASRLGYPLVIKPRDGNQGKGVTLNIRTEQEIPHAMELAKRFSAETVVERYLQGRNYRVLVIGGKVAAASERLPAFVVGDGKHTVKELVDITNSDPQRGDDHELPLTRIKIDDVALKSLQRQGLSLDSTPGRGNIVYLRENANLSTGGVAIDATDEIHPENAKIVVRAAAVVGLDVAGVDIVTDHISLPMTATGGAIIEINAAPGIRMHLFPWKGRPRDVGRQVVDYLFPNGNGRIPVISVTGTNGKTTTVRMISSILSESGYSVGMSSTDGVFVNGEMLFGGDASGPKSARAILRSPQVDAAVLETARGGMIREGLAFDRCSVAVITNIADDHLGQSGVKTLEDLAQVKSLIIETVLPKGYAVLNADDPVCLSLVERASGRVMLFSTQPDNIAVRKHVSLGGRAVVARNGHIVVLGNERPGRIMAIKDIPATLGGSISFNVQNALAAAAACIGAGVDYATVAEGLSRFKSDARSNPGRMNVIESNGFTVILDYGHNVPALNASILSLKAFYGQKMQRSGRIIGVVASPGDRADDKIVALGQTAASGFDHVVIKEDHDLRGRRPGETAALIKQGALTVTQPENVSVVLDEREAIRTALSMATRNDITIVYYEKYNEVLDSVTSLTAELTPQEGRAEPTLVAAGVPVDKP